jgi:hypothetical protein
MTTPRPLVNTNVPYELCVYRTRTGEVVKWVEIEGTPRWEAGINVIGSWSVQVDLHSPNLSKPELNAVLDSWYWSWAVVQGQVIHQAGPVIGEDFDDGNDYTTINGVGLWGLYKDKRLLINAGRASTSVITGIDADVAFGTTATSDKGGPIPAANQNVSLYTIAKRLLENEQSKSGGALPIVLPDAGWEVAGTAIRTYPGIEMGSTGQKQFDLTQVLGGPEIQYVPEFTSLSRSAIQHRVQIGKPRLGQLGYAHAWTYRQACLKLGFISDGGNMTDRDWDKGAGFERNVKTGFAENMQDVTAGSFQARPLLETAGQLHTSSENQTELDGYAAADVANGRTQLRDLKVEVSMNGDTGDGSSSPSPSFAAVNCGDTGVIFVSKHPRLPDGAYYVRVLRKGPGSSFKTGSLIVQTLGVSYT